MSCRPSCAWARPPRGAAATAGALCARPAPPNCGTCSEQAGGRRWAGGTHASHAMLSVALCGASTAQQHPRPRGLHAWAQSTGSRQAGSRQRLRMTHKGSCAAATSADAMPQRSAEGEPHATAAIAAAAASCTAAGCCACCCCRRRPTGPRCCTLWAGAGRLPPPRWCRTAGRSRAALPRLPAPTAPRPRLVDASCKAGSLRRAAGSVISAECALVWVSPATEGTPPVVTRGECALQLF